MHKSFQKIEGLVILSSVVAIYNEIDGPWLLFVLLLLAPDIFALGYIKDKKLGAITYNLGHTLIFPLILSVYGWQNEQTVILQIGLIWAAHVGMDHLAGYGLKLDKGPDFTTIDIKGKAAKAQKSKVS